MAVISKLEAVMIQRSLFRHKTTTSMRDWKYIVFCRSAHSDSDGNRAMRTPQDKVLSKSQLHFTSTQEYPAPTSISLPSNIEDIDASEKSRFSPQRSREITGSLISSASDKMEFKGAKSGKPADARMASYDCTGAVSLSSAMQTNVPDPFQARGKSTHLNMPGGQWSQEQKYMSGDLNNSHHVNTRARTAGIGSSMSHVKKNHHNSLQLGSQAMMLGLSGLLSAPGGVPQRYYSTKTEDKGETLSRKEQLKAAVKEYGAVVIVFHVSISLTSLGICYLAVTSGIDFSNVLTRFGSLDSAVINTAGPFIIAYAIHKIFAPARIAITLVSVPFIVRHLRKIGFIKRQKKD